MSKRPTDRRAAKQNFVNRRVAQCAAEFEELVNRLATEFRIDDIASLRAGLRDAEMIALGGKQWAHVNRGADKLDRVAKLLHSAARQAEEAGCLLQDMRNYLRLVTHATDPERLDEEIDQQNEETGPPNEGPDRLNEEAEWLNEETDRLFEMAEVMSRVAELAERAHHRPPKARPPLPDALVDSFKRVEHLWVVELKRGPIRSNFKETDTSLGRLEPGNEGVRFVCEVMDGLDTGATASNCKTLVGKYLTYKVRRDRRLKGRAP